MADTSIRVDETAALGVALAHAQQLADGLAVLLRQAIADRDIAERNAVELEQRLRPVYDDDLPPDWDRALLDHALVERARVLGDELGQAALVDAVRSHAAQEGQ